MAALPLVPRVAGARRGRRVVFKAMGMGISDLALGVEC